ncbi:IclR family transcriptional regulator [Dactylosporangium sp. NPDC048998]|uniref:IclR family transcriptional regulator n=1 Tax=Dactylosporangium sp. NPDC048998 TaxID=3363976 RepID=UPI0037194BFD
MADESPTLDLLERLAAAPDRMTFDALLRQVGLPAGVLRGRLERLIARGWVEADADGMSFAIGVGALRPGSAYLCGDRAARLAGPILSRLRDQLDESVRLVRLDGSSIVCLASRESSREHGGPMIGRRFPALSAASGRAILAGRPRAQVDAMLDEGVEAHTIDSAIDRAEIHAALADCRARGWAYERGELVPGVGCVAAAVPGADGPVTDAISCGMPLPRLTHDHAEDVAEYVLRATRELADALAG